MSRAHFEKKQPPVFFFFFGSPLPHPVDSSSPCLPRRDATMSIACSPQLESRFSTRCIGGYSVRSTFKSRIIVTESCSLSLPAYLSPIRHHPRRARQPFLYFIPTHKRAPSHKSLYLILPSLPITPPHDHRPHFHAFILFRCPRHPPRGYSLAGVRRAIILIVRSFSSHLPVAAPPSSSSIHPNCKIYLNCPYWPMRISAELTSKRPSISQRTPHDWPLVSRTFRQYKMSTQKRAPPSGRYWDSCSPLSAHRASSRLSSAPSASRGGCAFFWNTNSPLQVVRLKNVAWTRRMRGCGT